MAKVRFFTTFIFLSFIMGIGISVFGQKTTLQYNFVQPNEHGFPKEVRPVRFFQNKRDCIEYLRQLPKLLWSKGYLAASVDSVFWVDSTATALVFIGDKYQWGKIKTAVKDVGLLGLVGSKAKTLTKQTISTTNIHKSENELLTFLENNGYPFAKVKIDSLAIRGAVMEGNLVIDKGIYYTLDSIKVWGQANIGRQFLQKYLDLPNGSGFSREKLDRVGKRLSELTFLQQNHSPEITMLSGSFLENIYLQPRKSNQFDVLLGLLPNNNTTGNSVQLTGEANMLLNNPFATGESFQLKWEQLQSGSPRLRLGYQQPYIFGTPLTSDVRFELYKHDSSYLTLNLQLAALIGNGFGQTIKIGFQSNRTNLLTVDTLGIEFTHTLPPIADLSINSFSFGYLYNNTNYRFNPNKGNDLGITLMVGQKTIRKNSSILQIMDTTFNYAQLYDTVRLQTYQLQVVGHFEHYMRAGKLSVWKTALELGWIESPSYYRNELYFIGGSKLLRGFDEESIVVNGYLIPTIEYRYLLGRNSFFNVFADGAYTQNKQSGTSNKYLGIGVGLSFEAKQGIFNFGLAVGKSDYGAFDLKQTKVHIGYSSVF